MIPVGLGLVWAGYTLGVWGYCLVRGYNVTFTQLFANVWPGGVPVAHKGSTAAGTGTTQAPGTTTAGGRG